MKPRPYRRLTQSLPARSETNLLFDWVKVRLHLSTDRALAASLQIDPSALSNMRAGMRAVGPAIMVRLLEETGLSLRDLHSVLRQLRSPTPAETAEQKVPRRNSID